MRSSLKELGYDVAKAILVPAKALLQERHAPSLDNASSLSLLSPKRNVEYRDTEYPKRAVRRPIDEPTFLELLGSLEKIGQPGQNTEIWRYIFKKTPLTFPGVWYCDLVAGPARNSYLHAAHHHLGCGCRGESAATVPQWRHLSGSVSPLHAHHTKYQSKRMQRNSSR